MTRIEILKQNTEELPKQEGALTALHSVICRILKRIKLFHRTVSLPLYLFASNLKLHALHRLACFTVGMDQLPMVHARQTRKTMPKTMKQTVRVVLLVQTLVKTNKGQGLPHYGTFQAMHVYFRHFVNDRPMHHQDGTLQQDGTDRIEQTPSIFFLAIENEPQPDEFVQFGVCRFFVVGQMYQEDNETQIGTNVVQFVPFSFA